MESKTKPTGQEDLEKLIEQSDEQLTRRKTKGKKTRKDRKVKILKTFFLLLAVSLLFYLCLPFFQSVPEEQVEEDLFATLQLARESVEEYKYEEQGLPQTLPLSELASIVEYLPNAQGQSYILRVRNGMISYEWNSEDPETFSKVE